MELGGILAERGDPTSSNLKPHPATFRPSDVAAGLEVVERFRCSRVEGVAYHAAGTAVVSVRPSVGAVGVFRLVFTDDDG